MFLSRKRGRRRCLAQAVAREKIHLQDLTADMGTLFNTGTEHRGLKMFGQMVSLF